MKTFFKQNYLWMISLILIGVFGWLWFTPFSSETTTLAQITQKELYAALTKAGILLGILQFGLATWVKARIDESVKHEYAKKLEDYKNEARIREQAAGVARLLAQVKKADHIEDPEVLRIAWELSLWLPPDIFTELKKRSCGLSSDDDVKAILLKTRKLLLKDQAGELNPDDIPPFVTRVG